MTFSTSIGTAARSAAAIAGAGAVLLVAATAARTAGPMPPFQMPVACGQTWDASTYSTHWTVDHVSHQDAIDLAQRDEDLANLSEGEPAIAAASGTVKKVYTSSKGEHRVFIDHGNGWETDYIHLESVPPLAVGQEVAQGQMVGRVGKSGAESFHLHYNQMQDGVPSRVRFDGKAIDTYAGDQSSWGHYGSDEAESLTSLNCPGNSFLPFVQNGMHYQLIYKPSNGSVKIVRLAADAKGVTTVFSGNWDRKWTSLVPFTLSGGQQHLFAYQESTGKVRFDRINPQGEGTTKLSQGTWYAGWTNFAPFSLGGKPYFLAYDSLHGYAVIDRVNVEGSGSTKIYDHTWTKGWTQLVPYVLGGKQYLLLYKGGTGQVKVMKISGSGDDVSLSEVYSDTWSTGWTQLVPILHHGTVRLLAYKAETGQVSYGKLRSDGQGSQPLGSATWTSTWTAFTPFLQDGAGGVLIYQGGTGEVQVRTLNDPGTASSAIWTGSWTTGWT